MGCTDCSNLLPIFDSHRVTDVLFLSRDSSCLMLLKIWSPPGDWRLCRMNRLSVKNSVVRKSLFLVQGLDCCEQGVGFRIYSFIYLFVYLFIISVIGMTWPRFEPRPPPIEVSVLTATVLRRSSGVRNSRRFQLNCLQCRSAINTVKVCTAAQLG